MTRQNTAEAGKKSIPARIGSLIRRNPFNILMFGVIAGLLLATSRVDNDTFTRGYIYFLFASIGCCVLILIILLLKRLMKGSQKTRKDS